MRGAVVGGEVDGGCELGGLRLTSVWVESCARACASRSRAGSSRVSLYSVSCGSDGWAWRRKGKTNTLEEPFVARTEEPLGSIVYLWSMVMFGAENLKVLNTLVH